MRRASPALLIVLALASCGGEGNRPPVAPGATVVGEAQSCVLLSQVRETRVRDDWTIDLIAQNGRVWRNALPYRCSGPKVGNGFTYETSLSQLCNTDIIYVLELTADLHRGSACGLGEFVPVKLLR